jgi:glycyl-tRNA synthetase (class II)
MIFTKGQLKNSTVDESRELKKLVKKHKDTDLLTLKAKASKVGSTYTSKVGKLSKKKISKASDIKPSKSETAKNNDYKQNIKQANVTQQEKKYPHIVLITIGLSAVLLLVVVILSIRYIKK